VQDDLIGMLLRAALEETGAQRGLLILSRSGQCRVAGEAKRRRETIVVRLRDEGVTQSLLPESVLCHIQSTCESVVIDGDSEHADDLFPRGFGLLYLSPVLRHGPLSSLGSRK
jgi:hypothetical protein